MGGVYSGRLYHPEMKLTFGLWSEYVESKLIKQYEFILSLDELHEWGIDEREDGKYIGGEELGTSTITAWINVDLELYPAITAMLPTDGWDPPFVPWHERYLSEPSSNGQVVIHPLVVSETRIRPYINTTVYKISFGTMDELAGFGGKELKISTLINDVYEVGTYEFFLSGNRTTYHYTYTFQGPAYIWICIESLLMMGYSLLFGLIYWVTISFTTQHLQMGYVILVVILQITSYHFLHMVCLALL